MTKSELHLHDTAFIGPGLLFLNQYFNSFIDEYIVLWIALVRFLANLDYVKHHVLLNYHRCYAPYMMSLSSVVFRCCPWWIWCVTAQAYACKSPPIYESEFSASPHRATPIKTDNLPGGRRKRDLRMMTSSRFLIKSRKAPQTKTLMALTASLPQTNIKGKKSALFCQV